MEWLLCPQNANVTVLTGLPPRANKQNECGGDKTIKIHEKTAIKKC